MKTTAIKIDETNHEYLCRLTGLGVMGAYELAHMLNTTVEDVMCARGSWFETLAERARDLNTPDNQLKRGAPALKQAAIALNEELFRLSAELPKDDELIKAILAVRGAIHTAGGF